MTPSNESNLLRKDVFRLSGTISEVYGYLKGMDKAHTKALKDLQARLDRIEDAIAEMRAAGDRLMAWSIIRQATDEDRERLDAAAQRFAERYELRRWSEDVVSKEGDSE